ncbi:hypothetical protein WJX84_007751 [Apatococcus fuscideae]|uniref:P-loop containing nucleoside triphosphate hydrolase protein n=1 Tax=Apatococcus fuscideae TaxID=2026836 RepID=A0AAW1RWR8_9CHLO
MQQLNLQTLWPALLDHCHALQERPQLPNNNQCFQAVTHKAASAKPITRCHARRKAAWNGQAARPAELEAKEAGRMPIPSGAEIGSLAGAHQSNRHCKSQRRSLQGGRTYSEGRSEQSEDGGLRGGRAAQEERPSKWVKDGASPESIAALADLGITRPSHIQVEAYRALLRSKAQHVLLADQAGSGKTLAYLMPILQQIRAAEKAAKQQISTPKQPKAVIIAPTTELCVQILGLAKAIAQTMPFRSVAATGGRPLKTQREALAQGTDVLIGTPGRLRELLNKGDLSLDSCRTIVLDEADLLLGSAGSTEGMFAEQVAPLQAAAPVSSRFVLVTATLPTHTFEQLQQDFPGITAAIGPNLHRTSLGAAIQLVDCSGGDAINEDTGIARKTDALQQLLDERSDTRTLVFCNKIENCRRAENALKRWQPKAGDRVKVLPYHKAVSAEQQRSNLLAFMAGSENQQRIVLIATDRFSRGIDTSHVGHVVLFDFPRDPSEYIRRVGRTARGAAGTGQSSILVLGRQVQLAQQIVERNNNGMRVHRAPQLED